MLIHELAAQSGVPAKTIRYYEEVGLLPAPQRSSNNYRQYTNADRERLRFIASARGLGFSLGDIAKIVDARNAGVAPCNCVLHTLEERLAEINQRIADMLALRDTLAHLHQVGKMLPRDDINEQHCVCSLIKTRYEGSRQQVRDDHEVAYE